MVTITGVGFGSSPSVYLGDLRAEVQSADDTSITVVTPAAETGGPVDVTVRRGGGEAVIENGFVYSGIPMHFVDVALERLSPYAPASGRISTMEDMDDDGDLDIVQAVNGRIRIFLNDGEGTFTALRDGSIPAHIAGFTNEILVGDYNGDGRKDLYLVNYDGLQNNLLLSSGSLSFRDATEDSLPADEDSSVTGETADLDGDGDLDIVVTNYRGDEDYVPSVSLLINDGRGEFEEEAEDRLPETEMGVYGVAAADFDGDGAVDLFFAGVAAPNRLLLNDGEGYFVEARPDALPDIDEPGGRVPAVGDLDGDGSPDIYIPAKGQDLVFMNDGTGRFSDVTRMVFHEEDESGYTAVIADLDIDGFMDVVVCNARGVVRIYRSDGQERYFDYTSSIPYNPDGISNISAAVGDIDADGDPDIFISQATTGWPALLVNWDPVDMSDRDGDNVPDTVDNCPREANPDQVNSDLFHFNCPAASACTEKTGCTLAYRLSKSAYLICGDMAKTWEDARDYCKSLGADLVVIDDEEENEFLAGKGGGNFWLGLTDADTEDQWEWVDGRSAASPNWAENQPDDYQENEDCAHMYILPDRPDLMGQWNDGNCETALPFICEDDFIDPSADGLGDACTEEPEPEPEPEPEG